MLTWFPGSALPSWTVLCWLLVGVSIVGGVAGHPGAVEVPVLVLVPCLTSAEAEGCDVLSYYGILQAVEDINSNGTVINHGVKESLRVKLNISIISTKRDPTQSLVSIVQAMLRHNGGKALGIVGPSSNTNTQLLAYVASSKLPAVVVSYGATDIVFDKLLYSHLFRTIPSERAVNRARLCFMRHFKWKRFVVATSPSCSHFARVAENLVQNAEEAGLKSSSFFIEELVSYPLRSDDIYQICPNVGLKNLSRTFKNWTKTEYKIFVIILPPKDARSLLCQAYKTEKYLLETSHVWIFPHYVSSLWWNLTTAEISRLPSNQNCTNDEMLSLMNSANIITVDFIKYNIPEIQDPFTALDYHLMRNTSTLLQRAAAQAGINTSTLASFLSDPLLTSSLIANAYDSVWALTIAYHNIFKENLKLEVNNVIADMKNLSFRGTAKDHDFQSSQKQDFGSLHLASQFQDGSFKPILLLRNLTSDARTFCHEDNIVAVKSLRHLGYGFSSFSETFIWKGNDVPRDDITEINSYISLDALISAAVLDLIAFSICLSMLGVMLKLRKNKHIISMSMKLVFVAMLSATTFIPTNILYGLSVSALQYNIPIGVQNFICAIFTFVQGAGIMVTFTLFVAKNWRVYKIFYNSRHQRNIKGITNFHLSIIVGSVLIPFFIVRLVRMIFDPDRPFHYHINFNSTLQIHYSECHQPNNSFGDILDIILLLELVVVVFLLAFLSYKNSKISDLRFREEGQSLSRLAMACTLCFFVILAISILFKSKPQGQNINKIMFWILTADSFLSSQFLFGVVFWPKYFIIYREYREKKKRVRGRLKFEGITNALSSLHAEREILQESIKMKQQKIDWLKNQSSITST